MEGVVGVGGGGFVVCKLCGGPQPRPLTKGTLFLHFHSAHKGHPSLRNYLKALEEAKLMETIMFEAVSQTEDPEQIELKTEILDADLESVDGLWSESNEDDYGGLGEDPLQLPLDPSTSNLINSTSKELIYKCAKCGAGFTRIFNLRRHQDAKIACSRVLSRWSAKGVEKPPGPELGTFDPLLKRQAREGAVAVTLAPGTIKAPVPRTSRRKNKDDPTALFKCSKCRKGFSKNYKLSQHQETCLTKAERLEEIATMVNSGDPKLPVFKCPEPGCTATFTSQIGLDNHLLLPHSVGNKGPKTFQCSGGCGKTFYSKFTLKRHLLLPSTKCVMTSYPCKIGGCKEMFLYEVELREHLRWHKRTPHLHECHNCGRTFTSHATLAKHLQRLGEGNACQVHACPQCLEVFPSRWTLSAHHAVVHETKGVQDGEEEAGQSTESIKQEFEEDNIFL